MSNRIAASRTMDRVDFGAWMPTASARGGLMVAAQGWLARAGARSGGFEVPGHLRHDVGLAGIAAGSLPVVDFEARRVRV